MASILPTNKLYSLELLRGVAALAVLMLHSGQVIGHDLMISGYLAVDVFFALSGFVIALSYSDRLTAGLGFRKFFTARLIRFFPFYTLGIALGTLATLVGVFVGQMRDVAPGDVFHSLVFSLFFLPTPDSAISNSLFPLNPPSWSLFLELVANILFAGLLVWLTFRVTAIIVLMHCLALLFGIYLIGDNSEGFRWEAVSHGIPRVIFSFFLGVLMFRLRDRVSRMPRTTFLVPSLLLLAALSVDPGDYRALFDAAFVVVLSPILLIWAFRSEVPPRWRFLANYLGGISFCVYTIHLPFLNMAKGAHRVFGIDLGLMVALAVLALLLVSPLIVSRLDEPLRRQLRSRLGVTSSAQAKE